MKLAVCAMALGLAAALPAGAAEVGPCLWSQKPALLEQVIAAPDDSALFEALDSWSPEETRAAWTRCGVTADDMQFIEMVQKGYPATLRLQRRLAGQWSPESLAAAFARLTDAERGDVFRWMVVTSTWKAFGGPEPVANAAAIKLYEPFGRTPPLTPVDDLDDYWGARFTWWVGEYELSRTRKTTN